MGYVALACRAALFVVFLVSVISKVRGRSAFAEFAMSVAALRVVSPRWSRAAAFATLVAEVAVAALLAVPWTAAAGFVAGACLLTGLTAAIGIAVRRGHRASCRCFGASRAPLGALHLIRNLVLIGVCGGGLTGVALGGAALQPAGVVLTLAVAAVGALFVVRLDDLMALMGSAPRVRNHHAGVRRRVPIVSSGGGAGRTDR